MRDSLCLVLWFLFTIVLVGCSGPATDDDDSSGIFDDDDASDDDDAADDDDASDDDDSGADDDDASDDDDSDDPPEPNLFGFVTDLESKGGGEKGMSGVVISSIDDPNLTATTGATGEYELDVGLGSFALEAAAAERYPVVVTGDSDTLGAEPPNAIHPMFSSASLVKMAEMLSVSQEEADGMLWIMAVDAEGNPALGTSVEIAASNSGSLALGDSGLSIGNSYSEGVFMILFPGIAPGDSGVTVTPSSGETCVGPATTPVYAGKASMVRYVCQ
jgi:hypothetical protein